MTMLSYANLFLPRLSERPRIQTCLTETEAVRIISPVGSGVKGIWMNKTDIDR